MKFAYIYFLLFISASLYSQVVTIEDIAMKETRPGYGIKSQIAPELNVAKWVDGTGKESKELKLADLKDKFKVIYCFQSWCPGCHSIGLPALQKMTRALEERKDIQFLAIQTVFEGKHANTYERMLEIQKEYELEIPFGHDTGNEESGNISTTMGNYRTGGTPWFIFINKKGEVIFNDFHLNTEKAIEYLKSIK